VAEKVRKAGRIYATKSATNPGRRARTVWLTPPANDNAPSGASTRLWLAAGVSLCGLAVLALVSFVL